MRLKKQFLIISMLLIVAMVGTNVPRASAAPDGWDEEGLLACAPFFAKIIKKCIENPGLACAAYIAELLITDPQAQTCAGYIVSSPSWIICEANGGTWIPFPGGDLNVPICIPCGQPGNECIQVQYGGINSGEGPDIHYRLAPNSGGGSGAGGLGGAYIEFPFPAWWVTGPLPGNVGTVTTDNGCWWADISNFGCLP